MKRDTTTWQQRLADAQKLRGQGGRTAYQRIKLLASVFEDSDFRGAYRSLDDFGLAGMLDDYLGDLCISFLEARAVLAYCPEESRWERGSLRDLYDEAVAESKAADEGERESKKHRRATLKDLDEANEARKHVEAQLRTVQAETKRQATTIEKLLAENRELRDELAKAQGRILELERVLSRELQTA